MLWAHTAYGTGKERHCNCQEGYASQPHMVAAPWQEAADWDAEIGVGGSTDFVKLGLVSSEEAKQANSIPY